MSVPSFLVSSNQLQDRLVSVASQISTDYKGLELDIVCLFNSASFLTVDLCKYLSIPVHIHYLAFSAFPKPSPSGSVQITFDPSYSLKDRHILLTEGMIISGRTPKYIVDHLALREPASISILSVGIKPKLLTVSLPKLYTLYEFTDEWVCGYGIGDNPVKALPSLIDSRSVSAV